MGSTNYPDGFSHGVTIRGMPMVNSYAGKVFWVDSTTTSSGTRGTFDRPFTNITDALARCTANNGDVILVKASHAETLIAAGTITVSVAGVSIIGLGSGADRPKLTFSTSTAASVAITAASVTIENIIGISGIDALLNPFNVTGSDCWLDIEWQDSLATVEATKAVLATTVSRLYVKLRYVGFATGDACLNAIVLTAVTGARIIVDAYGEFSTGIVEMLTTASTDVLVTGYFYNDNVALTKNVVNTGGLACTWYASGYDGKGGYSFSGGSAAALAADDSGSIAAAVAVIDGLHDVPTADATTNLYIRDVVGIKTDAAVTTVANTKSLMAYAKGNVNQAVKLDSATIATNPTAASLATFIASGGTSLGTQLPATCSLYDVLAGANGIPVFPASAAPANTVSMAEVLREVYDQQEKGIHTTAAVMSNALTLFTIAGGPILLLNLLSVCVTANDATASTLLYSADPTDGAATALSTASATLASATAGTITNITGTVANQTVITVNGTAIGQATPIVVPIGIINITVGVGSTTGTWAHYLRYKPLGRGVTVTAAF